MSDVSELESTLSAVVEEHGKDVYEDWCAECGPSVDESGYAQHVARLQVAALMASGSIPTIRVIDLDARADLLDEVLFQGHTRGRLGVGAHEAIEEFQAAGRVPA